MKKTIITLCFVATAYILNAQVLYGTTFSGGINNGGTICKLNTANNTLTTAFSLEGTDGANPQYSKLLHASDGRLYGMTSKGGSNDVGTIFSYDPAASAYTPLKSFDGKNGAYPQASLIQASDGKLYGMTGSGGRSDYGVIFSYDIATSAYTKLTDFDGANGGGAPGSLVQASDGKLYGMTWGGGSNDVGTIFSYDPATSAYTKLKDFDGANGATPFGSLIQASDRNLYGMTYYGGSYGGGVIFSYDLSTSVYSKLKDFDYLDGINPRGSLIQASDGKLYGMTYSGGGNGYGIIFSYDPASSIYTKLRDFGINNTGNHMTGALIKDQSNKLHGMTSEGGSFGVGTIFSYDANASVFTKLKDFGGSDGALLFGNLLQASDEQLYGMTFAGGSFGDGVIFSYDPGTSAYTKLIDFDITKGAYPSGSLIEASDERLYGMTYSGGGNGYGVIFSYDPGTSTYAKLSDFDGTDGASPVASLVQASDGKLFGMTLYGGSYGGGVIFSYDIANSTYTKLIDFDGMNGASPYGDLIQAADGKLYGMTGRGGSNDAGVIFSFDPAASTYTKLMDFDYANGRYPYGSLVQASDGKLYGMTSEGGSSGDGVAFSYDPATSTYTKLNDFNGENGSLPQYTSFVEIPGTSGDVQISIADKSVIEGNRDRKFIAIPLTINEKSSKKIIRVKYTTQNITATDGSDYIAQSGTLLFPAGFTRIILPIRIKGDEIPEANETFKIVLSNPVNATIRDTTSVVTILDDDALALNASQKDINTTRSVTLSPNPAQDKVTVMLKGYSGNVALQLSTAEGRILRQQKFPVISAKTAQQSIDVSAYANGVYLVTVIDENGNRKTEKMVIKR